MTPLKKIPYVNLAAQHRALKEELLTAFAGVLDRSQFILGEDVQVFEQRFADLCRTRFAVALNSGTDALILGLRALGIGPGDEVITVSNSFVATVSCIALAGARPVLVDVRDDFNIDPVKVKAALTPRTKAILPVHLTGRPADMDALSAIAAEHNLPIVEDAAQAVLAEFNGRRVGSFGACGCFSLHPLKTLNACGDAGVLTTNDEALYEKVRVLRNHGLKTRENCVVFTLNSRLDTLQAAALLVKLRYVEQWTEQRRRNAQRYQAALSGIGDLKLPSDRSPERAVYHTFIIRTGRRNELKQFLADHGIETAIHYPAPVHVQDVGRTLGYGPGDFPISESQAREILSLPIYPELSQEDLDYVATTIKRFFRA